MTVTTPNRPRIDKPTVPRIAQAALTGVPAVILPVFQRHRDRSRRGFRHEDPIHQRPFFTPRMKLSRLCFSLPRRFRHVPVLLQRRHRHTDVHRPVHQQPMPGECADVRINAGQFRRDEPQYVTRIRLQHRRGKQDRVQIGHPVFGISLRAKRQRRVGHGLALPGLGQDEVVRHVVVIHQLEFHLRGRLGLEPDDVVLQPSLGVDRHAERRRLAKRG